MSQKELQRVAVISQCVQGNLACARAAELLDLSPRHIKRLKSRYRQGSAAALAHASRGRPSHRRLPQRVRDRILQLARARYAGFNDHHLCEKLAEQEGFSLSRETLRRLLRAKASARPVNVALPLIVSAVCASLAKASSCNSTAPRTTGSKAAARASPLWACRTTLPAKSWPPSSFRRKPPKAISTCSKACSTASACPLAFYGDRSGIFVRNDDHWTVEEQLAGKRQPTQFGRALDQLGITFIAAQSPQAKGRVERLWGVLQDRLTSELRLARACDIDSANGVLRKFIADYNRRFARSPRDTARAWRPAPDDLERICCLPPRTRRQQRQCRAMGGPSIPDPAPAPPLQLCREQKSRSTKLSTAASRSITATPASNTPSSSGVTFLCCR